MNFKVDLADLTGFGNLSYEERMIFVKNVSAELHYFTPLDISVSNQHLDIPIDFIQKIDRTLNINTIQIAAVKKLFDEKAFEKSDARILGMPELEPIHQVELDPIVLCEVNGGYIVVTAWGDESNDELLFDQKQN